MISQKHILYPLLLFLAIFAVDKIALIPEIRDLGRRDSTPVENLMLVFSDLRRQYAQKRRTRASTKEYLFLGSSRSELFEYIHPASQAAWPYLDSEEKKRILSVRMESRGILRASDIWLHYVMLHALLDSGVLPNYLIVEISPEMLNENSPHSMHVYIQNQTYDVALLWKAYQLSEGQLKTEILHRLLFSHYAYGFRPEKAIQNYFAGRNYLSKAATALALLKLRPRIQPLPPKAVAWTGIPDSTPRQIYNKNFVAYTKLMLDSSILKNYTFSQSEFRVLKLLHKTLQKSKQKVLYWTPKVHPNLAMERERLGVNRDFQQVQTWLKKTGAPYLDLQNTKLRCTLWADSSHLSDVCAPEVFRNIMEALKSYSKAPSS